MGGGVIEKRETVEEGVVETKHKDIMQLLETQPQMTAHLMPVGSIMNCRRAGASVISEKGRSL